MTSDNDALLRRLGQTRGDLFAAHEQWERAKKPESGPVVIKWHRARAAHLDALAEVMKAADALGRVGGSNG